MPNNSKPTVPEQAEQKALVTRCRMENIEVIGIENSLQFPINAVLDIVKPYLSERELQTVKKRLQVLMATLTAKRVSLGQRVGCPDLFIPKYHTFIELKKRDGGKPSKEQLEMQAILRSYGYTSEIIHGAKFAWELIEQKRKEYENE